MEASVLSRDLLSISKSIHKPLIREKYVISLRHDGPSVGPSEVVPELTKDLEDVMEASVLSGDLLSISKSIHKPDRGDIDGYRLLIHNLRENSKRPHFWSLLYELSSRF